MENFGSEKIISRSLGKDESVVDWSMVKNISPEGLPVKQNQVEMLKIIIYNYLTVN